MSDQGNTIEEEQRRSKSYLEVTGAPQDVTLQIPHDLPTPQASDENGSSRKGNRKGSHISALDTAQVAVSWSDLKYVIPVKTKVDGVKTEVDKVIVNDLTGGVMPGDMMCVMGTSGSGKTSFLNLLAGRYSVGTVSGKVLCNGANRGNEFKRSIGYVEQDDLMFANLTVTEMLNYTALLRLPRDIPRADKLLRANEVIEQLGLNDCRNTMIGSEGRRGISGGERKRTSIGIELITNPRLLFMDEPTSGLDAYTAVHVMQTVKSLTITGRAVICSIHQPRDKIYQLFDKLLLLAKGEACYFGLSSGARPFFAQAGFPCPDHENLADFMLDVTTIDPRTPELLAKTQSTVDTIKKAYAGSEHRPLALKWRDECDNVGQGASAVSSKQRRGWNLHWGEEFMILLSRAFKLVTREPRTTKMAVFQAVFMAVLVGIVFFQLGRDQTGVRDRQGVLFFMILGNAFPALQATLLLFHAEKRVFNRERMGGAYRVSTYFLSKSTTDLPITVAPLFLYIVIAYFLISLKNTAEAFFKTLLMIVMVNVTAQSFGLFISASTPTLQVAQAVGPLFMVLLIMFGGFYLSIDSIPVWLKWLEVFSFLQYGFIGLIRVQFEGESFSCEKANLCLATGQEVIDEMGVAGEQHSYWAQFGKLLALSVGFRALAYLSLRFLHRRKLRFD